MESWRSQRLWYTFYLCHIKQQTLVLASGLMQKVSHFTSVCNHCINVSVTFYTILPLAQGVLSVWRHWVQFIWKECKNDELKVNTSSQVNCSFFFLFLFPQFWCWEWAVGGPQSSGVPGQSRFQPCAAAQFPSQSAAGVIPVSLGFRLRPFTQGHVPKLIHGQWAVSIIRLVHDPLIYWSSRNVWTLRCIKKSHTRNAFTMASLSRKSHIIFLITNFFH